MWNLIEGEGLRWRAWNRFGASASVEESHADEYGKVAVVPVTEFLRDRVVPVTDAPEERREFGGDVPRS